MNKEQIKSYREIAQHWNISENEDLIVLSIRGQMVERCHSGCDNCLNYNECFPEITEFQKRKWMDFINFVIGQE